MSFSTANHSMKHRNGFTLVEMLVVVSIIIVLAAIVTPGILKATEEARRVHCRSNQRQFVYATLSHSNDTTSKVYIPTRSGGDDAIAFLYPNYLPDPNVARCPSTENKIRRDVTYATSQEAFGRDVPHDLVVAASNALDESGHSYEIFAWNDGPAIFPDGTDWNGNLLGTINQQRGILPGMPSYDPTNAKSSSTLKNRRNVRSASNELIILDSDQGGDVNSANINNWPDPINNHMEQGLNIAFCDGHVQWIDASPKLIETYMSAHMVAAANWYLIHPTLKVTNTVHNGLNYKKYYYQ